MDSKKILIVDDLKNYIWVLSQALREEGFIVATAGDGEAGLDALKDEKPDLVLLDVNMPKMDGITMSKKMKELDIKVPIIFLTNLSDMKDISEAAGNAVDYIVKSDASVEEVVARVKEKLSIK